MKLHYESLHDIQGSCGIIETAASWVDSKDGVIVCHPDPQQHGTMLNKVVTSMVRAAHDMQLNTVRFNYRGVGRSQGEYGHLKGETEDLSCVAKWFKEQGVERFWLLGFSFGCVVTHEYKDTAILGRLWVAPPVERFNFVRVDVPTYLLQGLNDEIVSADAVCMWAQKHNAHLATIKEAGHFFHGKLDSVRSWTKDCLHG